MVRTHKPRVLRRRRFARGLAVALAAAGLVAIAAATPAQADGSGTGVPPADSSETGRIGANHNQVLA